jgi:hypothetical protein
MTAESVRRVGCLNNQRNQISRAALAAAVIIFSALPSAATKMTPRSSEQSCRQAVNGLISLIDAKTDNAALYRDTFGVVVNTCGPVATAPAPSVPPPHRDACHDLAVALVELIEDGKMDTATFVKARGDFALACAPR